MTYREMKDVVLGDTGTSYWLKEAIQTLDRRDPVDALLDARTLVMLMEAKSREMLT